MVVDLVVGRVLIQDGASASADAKETATGLDDVTTYYLLHGSWASMKPRREQGNYEVEERGACHGRYSAGEGCPT